MVARGAVRKDNGGQIVSKRYWRRAADGSDTDDRKCQSTALRNCPLYRRVQDSLSNKFGEEWPESTRGSVTFSV